MPKKIEIRFSNEKMRLMVRGVHLQDLEEAVELLLDAIIDIRTKIKENENSTKLTELRSHQAQ